MKITEYINFIKEQFNEIRIQFKLEWSNPYSEYLITLENENTSIRFTTFHREEGINIIINDKKEDEFYTLSDIIDLRTQNNNYLNEEDKIICQSFNDNQKVTIYVAKLIFKNHCNDLLLGDFSKIDKSSLN